MVILELMLYIFFIIAWCLCHLALTGVGEVFP